LEANPDIGCILLDIKMPVMDGIEFLDALSAYPHFSSTPIIILTTDESRKREALDKGAYDFLLKPIRENELNQKIDRVLELYP
ncbi:MAG: response regulator, partial [Sulfurospirillaceae bacterium]